MPPAMCRATNNWVLEAPSEKNSVKNVTEFCKSAVSNEPAAGLPV